MRETECKLIKQAQPIHKKIKKPISYQYTDRAKLILVSDYQLSSLVERRRRTALEKQDKWALSTKGLSIQQMFRAFLIGASVHSGEEVDISFEIARLMYSKLEYKSARNLLRELETD